MASLADWEVVNKLAPGFVAALLAVAANVVTHNIWQFTGHRNYLWFVGLAIALTYVLVFVFYLRGVCVGLPLKDFLIVQMIAILMVWGWIDAAFRIINCGFDRSAPTDVTAQVVGRRFYKTDEFLKLSAPPNFNGAELGVETDVYERARIGATVVVTWHKGALREGWCGRHAVRIEPPREAP
jgi:hypothetical protein